MRIPDVRFGVFGDLCKFTANLVENLLKHEAMEEPTPQTEVKKEESTDSSSSDDSSDEEENDVKVQVGSPF